MKPKPPSRIGIALWLNQEYARNVLAGALHYFLAKHPWETELFDLSFITTNDPKSLPYNGWIVIASHNETSYIDQFPDPKIAVPFLSAPSPYTCVATDSQAVGVMAAQHLLSLGLTQFAICRHTEPPAFTELVKGFRKAVNLGGGTLCVVHDDLLPAEKGPEWIKKLPPRCGILAQHDRKAEKLIGFVKQAGYNVPDDFAVVGVGNDLIITMIHHPSITSVELPADKLGWQAAQSLDRMINGEPVKSVTLPPVRIVQRQSTRLSDNDDPIVTDALRQITTQLDQPLDTMIIADRLHVSRRTLEYHFRQSLGRGVHEELTRQRLQHALNMLMTTTVPIKEIAPAVGIRHMTSFNRFIRQHTGMTPTDYRKQNADRPNAPS